MVYLLLILLVSCAVGYGLIEISNLMLVNPAYRKTVLKYAPIIFGSMLIGIALLVVIVNVF